MQDICIRERARVHFKMQRPADVRRSLNETTTSSRLYHPPRGIYHARNPGCHDVACRVCLLTLKPRLAKSEEYQSKSKARSFHGSADSDKSRGMIFSRPALFSRLEIGCFPFCLTRLLHLGNFLSQTSQFFIKWNKTLHEPTHRKKNTRTFISVYISERNFQVLFSVYQSKQKGS